LREANDDEGCHYNDHGQRRRSTKEQQGHHQCPLAPARIPEFLGEESGGGKAPHEVEGDKQ
jgi:hypothetical protein